MTKYIVKNCPAYLYGGCHSENVNFKIDFECCIKNNNCPIKQAIKLMTETCSMPDLLNAEELRLTDRGILAKQILQTLQVEEVE